MDKKDYFKISTDQKLPLRCPILNICQRRAMTVYYFSYRDNTYGPWEAALKSLGELSDRYEKEKVECQGEALTIISGKDNFYFQHTCPEVPLFDNSHRPMCVDESPCVKGDWDKYYESPKFRNIEEKHYSQCAEFNLWNYSKRKKNRRTISNGLRSTLQQEIISECPFCQNKDVSHFDVHHIDENPENNNFKNLIMLCKICHSKITKGEIAVDKVIEKKESLSKL